MPVPCDCFRQRIPGSSHVWQVLDISPHESWVWLVLCTSLREFRLLAREFGAFGCHVRVAPRLKFPYLLPASLGELPNAPL